MRDRQLSDYSLCPEFSPNLSRMKPSVRMSFRVIQAESEENVKVCYLKLIGCESSPEEPPFVGSKKSAMSARLCAFVCFCCSSGVQDD